MCFLVARPVSLNNSNVQKLSDREATHNDPIDTYFDKIFEEKRLRMNESIIDSID